jgi:hypothetical protein
MFLPVRRCGFQSELTVILLALAVWSMSGSSAFAQSGRGWFGGRSNIGGYGSRGYYPYYGYRSGYSGYPGYNIYGNYGVYGYPGSGIEGGYSNPGYDSGHGGYPSYGGYGIPNSYPASAYGVGSPATGVGYSSAYVAPASGAANTTPTQGRLLGIDEEPVVVSDGAKAMKVAKVFPGSAAERAGLQAGDVIRSINGYLTEQRGNLAWIIANKTPNNELKMTVQAAKDGRDHLITATLP